jgi:hypothetical protein
MYLSIKMPRDPSQDKIALFEQEVNCIKTDSGGYNFDLISVLRKLITDDLGFKSMVFRLQSQSAYLGT